MSRVLRAYRSKFYAWCKEPPRPRSHNNERRVGHIRAAYDESEGSYGSPRICKDLREVGEICGKNCLTKLLKMHGIKVHGRYRKLRYRYSRPSLVTPNCLFQEFTTAYSDQAWVTDIIYVVTSEDWLSLAVVIDLYSRCIVGWAMSSIMTTDFVLTVLLGVLWRRRPKRRIIIHLDQRSQFNSNT